MNRKNEKLHENFRKTAALLRRNRVREFGNYPDTQNRILSLLAINDGMNQRQLAYLLGIIPQSAGELLGKLENGNLISRKSDENDGRVNLVYLTENGRKKAETLAEGAEREDVFDCLSDDEKNQLEGLLGKIVETHPLAEEEMRGPRHGCHGRGRHFGPEGHKMPEGFRPMPFENGPEDGEIRPMPFHRPRPAMMDEPEDLPFEEEISEI
ncbi:MAG: MarR family transcriptional regulator [Erysipelotrichaceae bacterium]|nr:MarR family transcriptional regulator [Erysipelotrichaceae bacterium]